MEKLYIVKVESTAINTLQPVRASSALIALEVVAAAYGAAGVTPAGLDDGYADYLGAVAGGWVTSADEVYLAAYPAIAYRVDYDLGEGVTTYGYAVLPVGAGEVNAVYATAAAVATRDTHRVGAGSRVRVTGIDARNGSARVNYVRATGPLGTVTGAPVTYTAVAAYEVTRLELDELDSATLLDYAAEVGLLGEF